MDFYIVLCICLTILVLFDVGEVILKNAKIKKNWAVFFLVLSILFFYLPSVDVGEIKISFNFILYFITFLFAFLKCKNIKQIIRIFVVFCIALALCVCYNSLNLLQFEFAYFQPYILLAVLIGTICATITDNHNTIYSGLLLAISISELIRSGSIMFGGQNKFCLGDSQFLCLMIISLLSFLCCLCVKNFAKKLKQQHQIKKQSKQQNA